MTHLYVRHDSCRGVYGYGYSKGGVEGRMVGGLIHKCDMTRSYV